MGANRNCKGCDDSYIVTESQISRVLASDYFSTMDCVDEVTYAQRVEACTACSALQNGTTCSYCGCIIQIVAKLKDRRCPHTGGSRWME
jgi:hypothetical protein